MYQDSLSQHSIVALGSFTGKGFQFTTDTNSKLNWCFFISRLALKENINFGWKRICFKLTKKKVMGITYKEKRFLEFQDHWGQVPHAKTEFRSLWFFSSRWRINTQFILQPVLYRCSPFMDFSIKSLSLMHLAIGHASHLAFAIQGDR